MSIGTSEVVVGSQLHATAATAAAAAGTTVSVQQHLCRLLLALLANHSMHAHSPTAPLETGFNVGLNVGLNVWLQIVGFRAGWDVQTCASCSCVLLLC